MSRPIRVLFQGWESTTVRLAQSGWDIAVQMDFDYYHDGHRVLFGNKNLRLYGLSDMVRLRLMQGATYDMREEREVIQVNHIAPNIETIRMHTDVSMDRFRQVDAIPEVMEHTVTDVDSMNIFKWKDEQPVEQFIIEQADMTVVEHLEAIKKIQQPKQQQIRERMVREEVTKTKDNVVQLIQVG